MMKTLADTHMRYKERVRQVGVEKATQQVKEIRAAIERLKKLPAGTPALLAELKDEALWLNHAISAHRVELREKHIVEKKLTPFVPLIEIAGEVVDGGRDGGKKSGKVRLEKAKTIKQAWQREAEKIWRKHPAWSKKDIAREITKRIGGNIDTIRKSIQKPLP